MNHSWQEFFWTKRSQPECSWWVLHSTLWICQFYPFSMGYPEEMLSFARHTNLCIHNSEKNICSFGLSLFSYFLALVYQLIVRSNCAFVLSMLIILVVRQAVLFRMTRINELQFLIHIQDWVKVVVFRGSKCQTSFVLFYLRVLPPLCREYRRNCTTSYEFLTQWYSSPSSLISWSRVVATGMPTSELWCVKSILLATVLLGS